MFKVSDSSNSTELQVEVVKSYRVGQSVRINPSMAYLGIDSGIVKVLGFIPPKPDNETVYIETEDNDDILSEIENFKEVMLQGYTTGDSDYADLLQMLDNEPWVVYRYSGNHIERHVLPAYLFVQHTMMY
jgi:hypothetical protein